MLAHYFLDMCGRTVVSGNAATISRRCTYTNSNGAQRQPSWPSNFCNRSDTSKGTEQSDDCEKLLAENAVEIFKESFNIGPQAKLPVLIGSDNANQLKCQIDADDDRCFISMKWGLETEFLRSSDKKYSTFNCRFESQ